MGTNEVARRCGTTDDSVRAWRRRFEREGVEGVETALGFLEALDLRVRMRVMNGRVRSHPSQPRYSPELKDRAVRMVLALRAETGETHGSVWRVPDQLDVGVESLRAWVKQHQIHHGERPGTTGADADRIRELEPENRELRRANEILKAASAFFARELNPRLPR